MRGVDISSLRVQKEQKKRKEKEGKGNLHVKKHSGKTVPAGNWSLIGSEVERDQLALLVSLGKEREPKTKVEVEKGLGWGGGSVPV